ncbi:MAG: hypothetical protein NTZ16_11980 [Verrucomicrobia bacterium]|nr:hypothetical protein [Verrucomicrobiota bacterium]
MMKTIHALLTSLVLLTLVGQLHAVTPQLIFADDFTSGVAADTDINLYQATRQHGSLAPQSYTETGSIDWQMTISPALGLRIYPSGGSPSPRAQVAHNFTEKGEFHVRIKLEPVSCDYCFVDVGTALNAAHRSANGIAFEVYGDGTVKFYAQGVQVAAVQNPAWAPSYTLDVYVSTAPNFAAGGSAVINARINGDIFDLNGSVAGYGYTTASFTQNYIMFGGYATTTLPDGKPKEGRVHGLWLFDRTPIHGVGWFNSFVGPSTLPGGTIGQQRIDQFSPAYFQEGIPYYGTILGKNLCTFASTTQPMMDKQLDYIMAAGLKYIVWDTLPPAWWPNNILNTYGLQLYLTSDRHNQIPFCADFSADRLLASNWGSDLKPWYLNLLTNPAYLKVLDDRPLLYVLQLGGLTGDSGITAKAALDNLRAASIAQGSGDPYIVGHCWSSTEIANAVTIFGDTVQAYSRYAGGVAGTSAWNGFRNELTHKYLPNASTGWDTAAKKEVGERYPVTPMSYEATPDKITAMLSSARSWVNDYPLSAEVTLVHSYGWAEGEGGRVIPSMFNGVDRINAFAKATGGAGVPGSFELGTSSLTHAWTTINFTKTNDYPPVVILGVPSNTGMTPVVTRVRNVTRTSFQARVQEFECDDGTHGAETVHWLAIPPGTYTIDGKKVYAAKAWVTDDLRLFEDDFNVTDSPDSDVNYDIVDNGIRLKGFTAYENVIPYVAGGASWQQVLINGAASVKLYPNGAANPASLTPDYNFKDYGGFRIEAEMKAITADYMVLACGSQSKNNLNPADGFAVRVYQNGDVRCYSQNSEITAARTTIAAAPNYVVNIAVDTPPAFNGSGPANFRVTVNGQAIDFNGATAGGLCFSRTSGLMNNYITLGAYCAAGGPAPFKYGYCYNLKVFAANATFVPTDAFPGVPVVLAQVETDYNTDAVVPRVFDVTTGNFQVHLQPQESKALFTSDGYQVHSGEITDFVVMEQGTFPLAKIQAGLKTGIANTAQTITFGAKTSPKIFATLNTFDNFDPVVLRQRSLTTTSVQIFGQEETSYDAETTISTPETAGWAVFGQ